MQIFAAFVYLSGGGYVGSSGLLAAMCVGRFYLILFSPKAVSCFLADAIRWTLGWWLVARLLMRIMIAALVNKQHWGAWATETVQ